MTFFRSFLAGLLILLPLQAVAFFDDLFDGLDSFGIEMPRGLSEDSIIKGLKEALEIGTGNAVKLTAVPDGFLKNEAIRIPMPAQLQQFEQALRVVGYGPQLDEFVISMNRGAERAAGLAQPIFLEAIKNMSFQDAKAILEGGDTAATEYFQQTTSEKLRIAFLPQVQAVINQVGVARQYRELVESYEAIPFVKSLAFDLDQYVVDQTLKGLFYVVGEEEKKIRTDPSARVTEILQEVFGSRT